MCRKIIFSLDYKRLRRLARVLKSFCVEAAATLPQ